MSNIQELLDKLTDDFESVKQFYELRTETHELEINYNIVDVKMDDFDIVLIKGDPAKVEFWRALRNFFVGGEGHNDDCSFDQTSYNFQKELIENFITGEIKVALIGQDEDDLTLVELGNEALKKDYVPIYWCWCHDRWSVNEHVKKALLQFRNNGSPDLTDFTIRIPKC